MLGTVTEFGEKVKVTLTGVKSYDAFVKFDLRGVDAKTGKVLFSQTIEKRGVSMGEIWSNTAVAALYAAFYAAFALAVGMWLFQSRELGGAEG